MKRYAILLLLFQLFACSSTQQRQGIREQVFWISGNQLPGPGLNRSPQSGVQRELFIYELTTTRQATMSTDGFFTNVQTKLVATFITKPDGSFKLRLPPGQYSVLVKETEGLYANLFDKNNAINPILVKEKQYTWLPISIDYQASY